ncbi:unnamed protein product [Lepeophtheirus salmonis]|uniref:(salmon louse) hypothetical protein n=1 Tax=Lepeophtheirus salmonis TaxID=72036 RepID=A0A7R8H538_LEPSM|nr:unnamed protein product [Lepeophtheirus salmonis]CAF2857832.1 unnamed protein product [Lepeophtheirus salmonis]
MEKRPKGNSVTVILLWTRRVRRNSGKRPSNLIRTCRWKIRSLYISRLLCYFLPGGPKFINFLITFVRWIALNFIRSNPSKFHEERLSSHFLSSKETTHSLRNDLLKKGKEYIKGLSFKYRVKKSWLDANQVQYNSDYLEELIKRRKDLEEKVNIVSNQMNRQIQQLNLDMSFIKFLQNLSSNVETLDISPCLQKCASFEEYICLVSKELSSGKLPKEEQAVDTPCSRYNLRCISTFSPVLSSSLMINPIETRKCISPTHPIASTTSNVEHNSSKMEYSDLTLDIIERYKMFKIEK